MPPTATPTAPSRLPPFLRDRIGGFPRPFWALWAGTLINRLGTMVQPYLALYLTTVRDLSIVQAGAVAGVLGGGSIASQVIGGTLADRIGRRITLAISTFGAGISMLMLAYAQGPVLITGSALLLGLTLDMYRPASYAMVSDLISPADRPRAFGILFWAINLGWAFAMMAGGTLARHGFVLLFWVNAVACMAFGLLVWRAVPERRRRGPAEPGGFGEALRDRVLIGYLLILLAYGTVLFQCMTTMPLAMKQDGLSPQDYGLTIAANALVIIAVQPLVGAPLARRDHSRVIAAGSLFVGAGYGLMCLASTTPGYAGAIAVLSLGEVAIASVMQAVVADLAPPHLRGRYGGMWGISWCGGLTVAPLVGTRLLEAGPLVLWLSCVALSVAAGGAQLLLAPAIRRRTSHFRQGDDIG